MTSPDDFDPYLNWLGIQPHERPIDHYRLLGVARFEANLVAIATAADHRMMSVRQHQTGPRGQHTQQILNELTAAKLCLLDVNTKATYDAVLQGQLSADPVPPPPQSVPVAVPVAPAVATPTAVPVAVAAPPVAKPVEENASDDKQDAIDEPGPFYTRGWFPMVAVGMIVLIAAIVWGIGISMNIANRDKDNQNQNTTTPPDDPGDDDPNGEDPVEPPDDPPESNEVVIQQEGTGGFNFPPITATLAGNLTLDTQNQRGGIVDWATPSDVATWKFKVIKAGFFKIRITYGCDETAAGAKFRLQVGKQKKLFAIRESGDPGKPVTDEIIMIINRKGQNELRLECVEFPENGSFNLESIEFGLTSG